MIEGFELSPQQRHLWMQMAAHTEAPFNVEFAILIEGTLSKHLLSKALSELVARCDVFSTNFKSVPGMLFPLQVIDADEFRLGEEKDVSDLVEPDIEALLEDSDREAFDLAEGSLLHATLIVLSGHRYVLRLQFPALLADGGSLDPLIHELATCYEAALNETSVEEEPVQYVAVAQWLNEMLESEEAEEGKLFWSQHDPGFQPAFSFEKPKHETTPFDPDHARARIIENWPKLKALAESYDTDPETVCFAVWAILLARHLDDPTLVIGKSFDGRDVDGLEGVVGLLARVRPITLRLLDDLQFNQVLAKAVEAIEEAGNWQEYYDMDQAGSTALDFEYEGIHQPVTVAGITFSEYKKQFCSERFRLKLSCRETEKGLETTFHYDRSYYAKIDIEILSRRFKTLISGILENPRGEIGDYNLLSQVELDHILVDFNQTDLDCARSVCIQQLFEEQAARTPEGIALECSGFQLTYADLNARANQLAAYLVAQGVKPETFVGVFIDRSWEMVLGLMAVLKAGGVYMPLDAGYPRARLDYKVSLTHPPVILTVERLLEKVPENQARVICVDRDWGLVDQPDTKGNAPCRVDPLNLAYVIFTSGSTGKPKGVLVSHDVLATHCQGVKEHHKLTPDDRFLEFAAFNFDASLEQVLPSLISGATVVVRTSEIWGIDGIEQIQNLDLTIVNFPTAYWHILAKEWRTREDRPNRLRMAIAGGEAMLSDHVNNWQNSPVHDVTLVNAYGPTEATVTATTYKVPHHFSREKRYHRIPIGYPMSNRKIYILDAHGRPAVIGLSGELYIGGSGLARCYHLGPAQTATVFVPDPFSQVPGARLYKTGDLARFLPEGSIQFLGRIDSQVKIRGFRIELGEIEQVLIKHPAVEDVAVIAREQGDSFGDKRLVAYFVPSAEVEAESLRQFLLEDLPDHMVPHVYVEMEQMPLLPNGKIDRQGFPEPDPTIGSDMAHAFEVGRTPTEEVLLGLVSELLDEPEVGIYDNFFQLGGHSLLATRLVSRLRTTFSVELRLRDLFPMPDFAALATWIDDQRGGNLSPPLVRAERDQPLPLSFAQQRLWFLHKMNPQSTAYNVPAALEITGVLDVPSLERTIGEIISRHEVLRTSFSMVGDQPVQVIHPASPWSLPEVDLSHVAEEDREREMTQRAEAFAQMRFDLQNGPLIAAELLTFTPKHHAVLFNMHHIASDGWSLGVLVHELAELYIAFSQEHHSPLADLDIQYADFSVWQRNWLQGEAFEREQAFWIKTMAGAPMVQNLPLAGKRPETPTHAMGRLPFELSEALTAQLKTFSRVEAVTMFMLILASLKSVIHAHTGDEDLIVGTDVANRNHQDLEGLIGFFINQLVMRTHFGGDPSFKDLLGRVRETSLAAYSHQDLPFDKLVEVLNPDRSGGISPLFQIKFVLQNAPISELELPGLVLKPIKSSERTAKFDLLFNLGEAHDKLEGTFDYNRDLYTDEAVQKLSHHLRLVLEQVVANPDSTLSQIKEILLESDRLEEEERRKALRSAGLSKLKNLKRKAR